MTIVKYFIYYLFTGLISIIGVFGGNPIPDTDKIPEEDIWRGAVLYLVLIAIWVSISFFLRKKRTKSKKACVGIAVFDRMGNYYLNSFNMCVRRTNNKSYLKKHYQFNKK